MTIPAILLQHAEEVAVLWGQRDYAVRAPHYSLKDLQAHDNRLAAHLDGLLIGAGAAAEIVWEQFDQFPEAGEAFSAAWHGLASGGRERFEAVVDRAIAADVVREPAEFTPPVEDAGGAGGVSGALRGVASALGWAEPGLLGGLVADFLSSDDPNRRLLGVAACALHRRDPGAALKAACEVDDVRLAARAVKAAGELGRRDLAGLVANRVGDDDPSVAAFAAYASALLRVDDGRALGRIALEGGPLAAKAATIAPRLMSEGAARGLLSDLRSAAQSDRSAARRLVQAVGAFGDPAFLPWLLERCEEDHLARVAGEAIALISGLDLAYQDLDRDPPEGGVAGPTDDPADEDVAADPDADLPWPDFKRISNALADFSSEKGRWLCGRPVSEAGSLGSDAPQRTRRAASYEVCTRSGGVLANCSAPGHRQA